MCASDYLSKLRDKGIDGMYVRIELLYKHIGTPWGFLTKRCPTPRAKRTGKRSVWKVRQNDLMFRMNHLIREVLNKVLLGVRITEPNSIRNRGKRRKRWRTTTWDQVLGRDWLFGCHSQKIIEGEGNKTETQQKRCFRNNRKDALGNKEKEKYNAW